MKKYLLFRLMAFVFLCFCSLLIKSETTVCNLTCSSSVAKYSVAEEASKVTAEYNPIYNDDGFFIKI